MDPAAATVLGWWWRREGRLRTVTQDDDATQLGRDASASRLLADIGADTAVVTLLQFSTALCAPCRTTRRLLADVGRQLDRIQVVEVDAERHLDACRELDVWR
ncbi:thioredoxin family protein [Micromonospora schwarzwaldensis]|uniref:thioredoxin family protein n=1 Tax=Micromonospora sp. DSM 45708 TaxID=3111767 RepID=UPI0031DFA63D